MKKILCLILSAVMMFSCFGMCMTASAADYLWRPDEVANVIDPVLKGVSTVFADSINELGYESVNNAKTNITEETFDYFLYQNADDKMFGVDFDFLYSKDNSAFLWELCNFNLEKANNLDVHEDEVNQAEAEKRKSTCEMKGMYDACSAVLYGYEYDYETKSTDIDIFENIVEVKNTIYNEYTKRNETHYSYYYSLTKGEFSLMRANSNRQIINTVSNTWGNGKLYATPEIANKNAIAIANVIGNLLYPDFVNIPEDTVVFTDSVKMRDETFFSKVTELSGLDDILQNNWCNATEFDVKDIMHAFGVIVKDDVILNVELEKGVNMGARILTDIFSGFFENPIGYVTNLIQLFSRGYSLSYQKAFESLFIMKFPDMVSRSRQAGDKVDSYTGTELSTVDGLLNFITDCLYFEKVDAGEANAKKFSFAPLPLKRIANTSDEDELYLYFLCYFELNRIYEENGEMIETFINDVKSALEANFDGSDKTKNINALDKVLKSMFLGDLTFVDMYSFHLGELTSTNIEAFPDNFMSSIKNALASLIQRFVEAMDNFMNILFGWTGNLFG